MAPLSIQSGVKYAKTLLPETLVRWVNKSSLKSWFYIAKSSNYSVSAEETSSKMYLFVPLLLSEDYTDVLHNLAQRVHGTSCA